MNNKPAKTADEAVMCALIGQVSATAAGDVETNVRTVITRPMWEAFCRSAGIPTDAKPTAWNGIHNTIRVFGSETVIVESEEFWSVSRKISP